MKRFFKILKKLFLYSTLFVFVVFFSIYLYIENGAKIYFPQKEREELIHQIKSAPQLPDNFVNFYISVYPKSLQNSFWKRIYYNFTHYHPYRNDELPSQNVGNTCISPFLKYNKVKGLNIALLIRFIEQNTTQKECLNFEFRNFDFMYNRHGINAVSKDLFNKSTQDLLPIESAEIMALYENPVRNDRYRNAEVAKRRTNVLYERYQNYILEHERTPSK